MIYTQTTLVLAEMFRSHKHAAWELYATDPEWAVAHFKRAIDLCEVLIIRSRKDRACAEVYEAERKGLAFCLGELKHGMGNGTIVESLLPANQL